MDFNTGNLNFNKNNGRKRKAQSIQDMIGGGLDMESGSYRPPIRKSGYTGPYKQRTSGSNTWGTSPLPDVGSKGRNASEGRNLGRTGNTGKIHLPETDLSDRPSGNGRNTRDKDRNADSYDNPKPVGPYGIRSLFDGAGGSIWIIYVAVLSFCMLTAIIVFAVNGGSSGSSSGRAKKLDAKLKTVYEDLNGISTSYGIVDDLVASYVTGTKYTGAEKPSGSAQETSAPVSEDGSVIQTSNPDGTVATTNGPDAAVGTITSGLSMMLDSGNGMEGYPSASTHSELVGQLETALSSGDTVFVGSKLAYRDDYGELSGYPQSVVDHFTKYMAENADKRSDFINLISGEAYSATNGTACVIELKPIQFVVTMAYDNTTVSVEGFGDQVLNSGQQATIKPLLPCMYNVTFKNEIWGDPYVKEVEANLSELTLNLNVK
ncbi:MAG: hypothetical protein K5886_07790 [Lachnospiraceae bacterium]|nr:hypothetical protein [Lachnospiraceae bacterium]